METGSLDVLLFAVDNFGVFPRFTLSEGVLIADVWASVKPFVSCVYKKSFKLMKFDRI